MNLRLKKSRVLLKRYAEQNAVKFFLRIKRYLRWLFIKKKDAQLIYILYLLVTKNKKANELLFTTLPFKN